MSAPPPISAPGLRRVQGPWPGALWLSAMPGREMPFPAWEHAARRAGITRLVCLCSVEEIAARAPDYADARRTNHLRALSIDHPLPDFGVPADVPAFAMLVARITGWLVACASVAIHCNAGIGRTGMAAICVATDLGMEFQAAEAAIRAAGSGPETEAQIAFCRAFAKGRGPA